MFTKTDNFKLNPDVCYSVLDGKHLLAGGGVPQKKKKFISNHMMINARSAG